jgi:hypothetical protein
LEIDLQVKQTSSMSRDSSEPNWKEIGSGCGVALDHLGEQIFGQRPVSDMSEILLFASDFTPLVTRAGALRGT